MMRDNNSKKTKTQLEQRKRHLLKRIPLLKKNQ
jgi:hypothetical protein